MANDHPTIGSGEAHRGTSMRSRRISITTTILVCVVPCAGWAWAAGGDPVAYWAFDSEDAGSVADRVSGASDRITGNHRLIEGVTGRALKCDGFTTCVTRKAQDAPRLGGEFTIQAWVAVQAYPWGWCPIVSQRDGRTAGYLFGVDARGRVGLHLAVGGQWQECNSEKSLPLMQWSHVAATFDGHSGLALYINGEPAGHLATSGSPAYAPGVDLLIGRNRDKEPAMFSAEWGSPDRPVHFVFDGIIDEVRIHGRCLAPDEIRGAFAATRPSGAPDLKPRRLPSGPQDALRFGAFYHHLQYCEEWDAIWRGRGPDVVVAFDFAPVRLVFWRGISYAPCWVTEKGNWFTNEFMERGPDRKNRGCSESMSDKRAYYSHVKILENTDARAVVYWRNAPVGVNYEFAYVDEVTGWGDWSEEYHTIYPDGVAIRKVVMWSSNFKEWHEWCQSIEPLHPGQRPEDVLDPNRVLSVANMKGETKTFGWEPGKPSYGQPTIPGANIQITYLRSRFNPFLVLDDREGMNDKGDTGPAILRVAGDRWSEHLGFPWYDHWPVTQVPVLARAAQAADRPAHTWTSTQYSAAYEATSDTMTKIMLCGLTDKPIEALLPLAKSWLRPAKLKTDSPQFTNEGYDATQRAYVLTCRDPGKPAPLTMHIEGTADSPIVNLSFVVQGWGERDIQLAVDGAPIPHGKHLRFGHRRRLDGADLVLWLECESSTTIRITLTPS